MDKIEWKELEYKSKGNNKAISPKLISVSKTSISFPIDISKGFNRISPYYGKSNKKEYFGFKFHNEINKGSVLNYGGASKLRKIIVTPSVFKKLSLGKYTFKEDKGIYFLDKLFLIN